jgi:hypothetical protein
MEHIPVITQQRLKEVLQYDPETGIFIWLISPSQKIKVGSKAGTNRATGYRQIMVDGNLYLSHRLAWFYMTGEWPTRFIDHINGVRNDNRFSNLREATPKQSSYNRGNNKNNTSGFRGVCWHSLAQKWWARLYADGKPIHSSLHNSKEEAYTEYCNAVEKYHKDYRRIS